MRTCRFGPEGLLSGGLVVLVVSLLLLLAAEAPAAGSVTGVLVHNGDQLTTDLAAGGDTDTFTVELGDGGVLKFALKAAKGTDLLPDIRVFAPDGSAAPIGGSLSGVGTAKPKLKKFIAGRTGIYKVVVSAVSGSGGYTAACKVKNPKKVSAKALALSAGGTVRVAFPAGDGALVTVSVKGKSGPAPAGARILDPGGREVEGSAAAFTAKKSKLSLKKFAVNAGFGSYAVEIDGDAGGPATVDVKVSVKAPKIAKRKVTLPPEAALTAVDPGEVRQEDAGRTLALSGANFLEGTTALFSGEGVTVHSATVTGDTGLDLVVDVDAGAPYGPRDLTLVPPPLLGEPVTLSAAIRVLAPVPEVTGVEPSVVKQEDAGAVVVVTGKGFREGGSVSFSGAGLTVLSVTVDSPTRATAVVRVAHDAPVGPRDVTFTQPAAGGGAAGTGRSLLQVHYPDPTVSGVSPAILKQTATGVLVTLTGTGFRDGGTAAVSGAGVTVSSETRVSDTRFTFLAAVARDAPFGARDVTYTQPADGGGASDTGAGLLIVNAPDPSLASLSPNRIIQGQSGLTITLTGSHFRSGGTVTVAGTGLSASGSKVVSDTKFEVTLAAAADAVMGATDVTYTQPVAGGGASVTLAGGLHVDAPTPTVTAVSPTVVKQGETSRVITVTGTNFRSGGAVTYSGTGITVLSTTVVSAVTASVTLDVASDAAVGKRDVTFTQPALGGSAAGTGRDLLSVHYPDPTLTAASPSQVRRGESGTFTLTGSGFRAGGAVTTTATGITLSSPVRVDDSTFRVGYSIAADAPLQKVDLTYTQPADGGAAAVTLDDAFEVFSLAPVLTSISPGKWRPGDAFVPLTLTGDRFTSSIELSFSGTGITVHSTTYVSATKAAAVISVASNASLGTRDAILSMASGPDTTFDDKVTVIPADLTVVSVSHRALARGAGGVTVTIRGTNFRTGDTPSASGSGVTFSSVSVVDSTTLTAKASVTSSAAVGLRDLTLAHSTANGGRSATLEDAFEVVTASPTVSSVNPAKIAVTGSGGKTRTVTAVLTGTNYMTGATVTLSKTGGSGLSVVSGSEEVLSGSKLSLKLKVTGTATTGSWDVKVTLPGTLGNSGTTGNGKITLQSKSTLTVNQVLPDHGKTYGGERVVIHGGGFQAGAVVDFGTERAFDTVVVDENTIVTTVPQPSSASRTGPTAVDVKVTNPISGNATRTEAWSYAKDEETVYVRKAFPPDDSTGRPVTLRSTAVLLSTPIDQTTVPYSASSSTWPLDSTLWFETGGFTVSGGFRGFGPAGRWLVLSRTSTSDLPINSGGVYVVTVPTGLTSLGGNHLVPVAGGQAGYEDVRTTVSSSVKDSTAPTLSSISPADAATGRPLTQKVALTMSEEIDPLTVNSTNITLKKGSTKIGYHLELSEDLKTVTLHPHATLDKNTTYTTTVTTAVKDLSGNAFASSVSRTFKTGDGTDTTAPVLEVVVEDLPSSVDGSTTYVSGDDSDSSGHALSAGVSKNFDLYLPQSGFLLLVRFSDEGGAGIDPDSFSAKCSVAVGSHSANAELAQEFTVTHTSARWRIPDTKKVSTGENVTFTFSVKDTKGNASASKTITVDIEKRTATASASSGGNLDPFDSRQTWVLRTDLDHYTPTFTSTTTPAPKQWVTTTNSANGTSDLDESLRLCGLESPSMTADAAKTVNGLFVGTNAIVRNLFVERTRQLLRERYGIDADGTRDDDAPDVEFLLPGEQGSLSSLPSTSKSHSSHTGKSFSEMSLGGTDGAESDKEATAGTDGRASYDPRNLRQEADINDDGSVGVYLMSMIKAQVNVGPTGTSAPPFMRTITEKFVTAYGGTPVGEDASDDDVLAGTFDRTTSSNATHNARYDDIHDAVDMVALYASAVLAHEMAHSMGLVPDGAPKTGLFGNAHRTNTFTDADSTSLNTSAHLRFKGMNNLMEPDATLQENIRTGSDFRRFNPLALAWLRRRLLYDEGK